MRALGRLTVLTLSVMSSPGRADSTDPVSGSCRIAATPLNFGPYNPQDSRPTDSAGAVTIACPGMPGPLTATLSASSGNAATAATRVLMAAGQSLSYNLYTEPGRQRIWGDGTNGQAQIAVVIADPSAPVRVDVYGRIFARQNVGPGAYADTILVTLVF